MNNRTRSKILSLVMAAAMLFTLIPGVTAYAVDSGAPPLGASGVITAFDPLPVDVVAQTVATGTALADLNLPDTLGAEIGGEQGSVSDVTWQPEPDYNGATEGTYTFTADIPATYTVNAEPPVITVTLLLFAKLGMARVVDINIDPYTDGGISKAVTDAGVGDVIILTPGTYSKDTDRDITINKNLTIRGAGASPAATVIDAGGYFQIFEISSGCTVTIENITLTGGNGGSNIGGGAIFNNGGELKLIDCTFTGNKATDGGAIYNSGGELKLTGCTFTGNNATDGGAVYVAGYATAIADITSSLFTGNSSGLYIAAGASKAKINYNRIFNNTGYDLVDLVHAGSGGDDSDVDFNWWGDNKPETNSKIKGTVETYFLMEATATASTSVGNGGTVTFDYVFQLNNTRDAENDLLPDFAAEVFGSWDTSGNPITSFDARRDNRFDVTLPTNFIGLVTVTVTVDNETQNFPIDITENVPGVPQSFAATPGDGQVTLTWAAPLSDGGSPITHYEVSSDNGITWNTASTDIGHTFTGLTNGTQYTFKVRAVNALGGGAEASATATPADTAKTVIVGAQNGTLTEGTAGSVAFAVSTANIPSGSAITLNNSVVGITLNTAATTGDSTTVTISTTAATPAGNHPLTLTIDGVTSNNFTLGVSGGADTTPPTVISVSPSGTGVSRSGSIVITFSEAIGTTGTASLNGGLTTLSGGTWNTANTIYTIPYSGLSYSTTYTITIAGFKDAAGNPMASDSSHNFTTESSGGGSSSGGSSTQDTVRTVTAPQPVTPAQAKAAYAAALQAAKESGSDTVKPKLSGHYSELPLDILQALAGWAKRDGMAIRLTVDVTKDSSVTARYVLDPSTAERTISLLASSESPGAVNTATRFKRWFKNNLAVVSTGQTDGFGMLVDIAVKVDLTGFITENLYFYSYDSKTNQYRRIEKPAYWIDKNGYLHFTTELAGDIIISEGPLGRK